MILSQDCAVLRMSLLNIAKILTQMEESSQVCPWFLPFPTSFLKSYMVGECENQQLCSASGLAVSTRTVSTEIKSSSSQTSYFLFADSILLGTSGIPASICTMWGIFLTRSFFIMWSRECSVFLCCQLCVGQGELRWETSSNLNYALEASPLGTACTLFPSPPQCVILLLPKR